MSMGEWDGRDRRTDDRRHGERRNASRDGSDRRQADRRVGTRVVMSALAAALLATAGDAEAQIYTRVKNGVVEATNVPSAKEFRLTYPGKGRLIHSRGFRVRASNNAVYNQHIEAAAAQHGVSIQLVRAIVQIESQFDQYAVSTAGAQGLMQLMPDTARRFGVRDSFDARQNIFGGVAYLRFLLDMFHGDVELAAAGYNAGENAVLKYNGVPPYKETQGYVRKLRAVLDASEGGGGGTATAGSTAAAFHTPNPGIFGRNPVKPVAASLTITATPLSSSVRSASAARAKGTPLKPRTYYKWQGSDGVLHVSQDPPAEGTPFSTIRALD